MRHQATRRIFGIMWMCIGFSACNEASTTTSDMNDAERQRIPRDADICRLNDDVELGPKEADGMVRVPANHPDIFYSGRVDCSTPFAPAFAFPGVSIRARFEGDAVDMLLRDHGISDIINYYNIIVDGGAPRTIPVSPDEIRYVLARGLSEGAHTVEVFKRVESGPNGHPNAGKAAFLGFRIRAGRRMLPTAAKPRRMEFIGDSITCGYGNEISTHTPEIFPYTTEHSNAYNAFSAITARILGAEYLAVAFSGRGVVRNFAGFKGETLPEMYLRSLPEDPGAARWNINAYIPHVIVINLGTNDFSEGLDLREEEIMRRDFRREYRTFLETLRIYYPDTAIVVTLGPMINDAWPEGYNAWTTIRADVGEVLAARRDAGDDNVHLLLFPPQSPPYGEDWHPTVATHEEMADTLAAFIQELGVF